MTLGWNNPFFVKQMESEDNNWKLTFTFTWVLTICWLSTHIWYGYRETKGIKKKSRQQSQIESIRYAKNSKPNTMAYEEGDSVRKQNLIKFLKINWNLEQNMLNWYRTRGKFLIYHDHMFMNTDLKIKKCQVPCIPHIFFK